MRLKVIRLFENIRVEKKKNRFILDFVFSSSRRSIKNNLLDCVINLFFVRILNIDSFIFRFMISYYFSQVNEIFFSIVNFFFVFNEQDIR